MLLYVILEKLNCARHQGGTSMYSEYLGMNMHTQLFTKLIFMSSHWFNLEYVVLIDIDYMIAITDYFLCYIYFLDVAGMMWSGWCVFLGGVVLLNIGKNKDSFRKHGLWHIDAWANDLHFMEDIGKTNFLLKFTVFF